MALGNCWLSKRVVSDIALYIIRFNQTFQIAPQFTTWTCFKRNIFICVILVKLAFYHADRVNIMNTNLKNQLNQSNQKKKGKKDSNLRSDHHPMRIYQRYYLLTNKSNSALTQGIILCILKAVRHGENSCMWLSPLKSKRKTKKI